jgi:type I restriction enzyme S subunit
MAGEGWSNWPFSEVIDFQEGPGILAKDFMEEGVPLVRLAGLDTGASVLNGCNYLDPATVAKKWSHFALEEGDILLSTSASLGRVAVVGPEGIGTIAYTGIIRMRPRDGRVVAPFIRYLLAGPEFQHQVEAAGVGSVIRHFGPMHLRGMSVHLPTPDEQRAIAHILGTLDDKIELNRRMNETLEAIARAIFQSWFVDFDPVRAKAQGESPESICRRLRLTPDLLALFPDRLVDSELGEIPEGWKIGTLGDIAEHPRRGIQPSQIAANTPYIALEHMPRRCIALSEWNIAEDIESNKFEFRKGEILFGKLRPYFHKVGVAPLDGVCSTDIVVITSKSDEWFGFVLGHVSSDIFVEHTNAGSTGTKMPRTNWTDMSRYEIVMPPKSIAEVFTALIRPEIDRIIAAIHEARTLATVRDTLLPKLLSGELRVPIAGAA